MKNRNIAATVAAVALGLGSVFAAMPATATEAPPETVEVWWETPTPDGGWEEAPTAETVTWDQTYIPDPSSLKCGVWYQVDTYHPADVPALIADGMLTNGEDHKVVLSWRFVYGGDCPTPPAPANAAAAIVAGCGVADLLLSNDLGDAEERLSAAIVVYVDETFYEVYILQGGDTFPLQITFPEDSGDHTVGASQGDVFLASATIGTDCVEPQPEPIVTVTTTTATDCEADTVTTTTTTTTTGFVLVDGAWTEGEPVVEVVSSWVPATATECPPVVTPPVVEPPVVVPPVVPPVVVPPVVVAPPVVVTPAVVTPVAPQPVVLTVAAPSAPVLAATGFDQSQIMAHLWIAFLFAVVGAVLSVVGLVVDQRRRRVESK